MNDKKITQQVDNIIDSATEIEAVNAPPFFKDKVINRLSQTKDPTSQFGLLPWFAPKYQIAVLVILVALNIFVLYAYRSSNQEQEVQTFAQAYGLSSSENKSILN